MRLLIGFLVLFALVGVLGVGCGGDDGDIADSETPTVVLHPPGRSEIRVRVEVVRTPQEKARGLMFREHLDPDAGMLFIYDAEGTRIFWMKNTLIPLDMLFISKELRVAGVVENAEPQTETLRLIDRPSQFVLEVNGGFAAEHGITAGTEVEFLGIDQSDTAR